ncbi:hypothetical protein DICSQDRAFT_110833 [Dichomitus squalens LYAD-421 SS1]|uniref:Fungal-type protein kinase domain-containing protein n=1 Tax=Dichomitus squalens (strain LYAD-421) TaxID=732165 RepID=R7SSY9_DICSQ|nr:uncharacterized protein DICSQDRAFT_110833 [Dichomitus squalens LYAD-421 SS1]EJF58097.1 hypothetical protein DICSQDRAFT_110833 [Dichomitus squalens LYAD-421 SS1]
MGGRFHLLSKELFLSSVPGAPPTDEECKKFKTPSLTKKMSEHAIYPELGIVMKSVLDAAKCTKLRFLDTANHKAADGNNDSKATFNDGGIYIDSELARAATDFTSEHRGRSRMKREDLDRRHLGLRSWHWMDIPFEVKGRAENAAFYFKGKPPGYKATANARNASRPMKSAKGSEQVTVEREIAVEDGLNKTGGGEEAGHADEDGDGEAYGVSTQAQEKSTASGTRSAPEVNATGTASDPHAGDNPNDPIKIKVPPFVRLSKEGEESLGQFMEYMLNVQKYQHRTFCYAVYVCYDMARLFYFDRSGAFVSEPFEWTDQNSLLHQFVWKVAKLANAGQFGDLGHDPTATLVTDGLARDKFMALKDDPKLPAHIREGFEKAIAHNCPIYELQIHSLPPLADEWFPDELFPPSRESASASLGDAGCLSSESTPSSSSRGPAHLPSVKPVPRRFLVGRPHFAADALVGRCTKGYYAYDVTDDDEKNWRHCFLKDSWRPFVPHRTRPEHLVYERLRRRGLTEGIGTLICGGDVDGHRAQLTQVQSHLPPENQPVPRAHYRVAIKEIGLPVDKFTSFPELSAIFADVIKAHHRAWSRAQVLHRDISIGNIMILPAPENSPKSRRTGFLIDWDLSRLECELGNGPVEPDRSGTWPFRSALSLQYPWKPYRRSDDIESFVHAYLYLILRYHQTSVTSLGGMVKGLFEGVSLRKGIKVGGDVKLSLFGKMRFWVISNPELQQLLQNMIMGCAESYDKIDLVAMARLYGFQQSEETPPDMAHATDLTGLELDDDIPCAEDSDIRPTNTTLDAGVEPGPDQDPCIVKGFLSEPGGLVKLFLAHAACKRLDKDSDQFPARKHEDVYEGPISSLNRGIGSISTTGSFLSSPMSLELFGIPSGSMFASSHGLSSVSDTSTSAAHSDSRKRSRSLEEPVAGPIEAEGPESEPPARRFKRLKKLLTRGRK